jgi:hypothetical protein
MGPSAHLGAAAVVAGSESSAKRQARKRIGRNLTPPTYPNHLQ